MSDFKKLSQALFDRKNKHSRDPEPEASTPTAGTLMRDLSSASTVASSADFGRRSKHAFLCIWIKEARHLVAADKNPESSDPFVQVCIGRKTVYETRVVPRNRFPMWEQRCLVQLDQFNMDDKLKFVIWDRDLFTADDHLGEVQMVMDTAVMIAQEKPDNYANGMWHNVQYKKGTFGALCLGFQLLSTDEAQEVNQEVHKLVPDYLPTTYSGQTLLVVLNSLAGLRASGLSTTRYAATGSLYIRVRLNNTKRDMQMELPKDYGAVYFADGGNRLEIPIRLLNVFGRTAAPRPISAVAVRSPYDKFDVKIYLLHKDLFGIVTYLAKAQIPLWAIPTLPLGASLPSAPSVLRSVVSTDSSHPTDAIAEEPEDGPPPPSPAITSPPLELEEEASLQQQQQPEGREYTRIMEPYQTFLKEDLSLACTLAILPAPSLTITTTLPATPTAGPAAEGEEGDMEEVEGAEPVAAPEPLEESVLDCELPLGVSRLQSVLLVGYSDFVKKVHGLEKLLNMQRGPWEPGYVAGAVRKATYVKPLSMPMAPPQCDVQEEHKLVVVEDGGFIVEIHVRTTAPMGENFYVRQQLWGATLGMGKCRFRVTMQVVFNEKLPLSVRPLKGTIMKASANDARRGWGAMMDALRHDLAQEGRPGAMPPSAAAAAAGGVGAPCGDLAMAGGAGGGAGVGVPGWLVWVQLAALVLLVLLVWRLGGQVGRLGHEVRQLKEAVGSGSCSAPAGQ